jgi:hypothetical protein
VRTTTTCRNSSAALSLPLGVASAKGELCRSGTGLAS